MLGSQSTLPRSPLPVLRLFLCIHIARRHHLQGGREQLCGPHASRKWLPTLGPLSNSAHAFMCLCAFRTWLPPFSPCTTLHAHVQGRQRTRQCRVPPATRTAVHRKQWIPHTQTVCGTHLWQLKAVLARQEDATQPPLVQPVELAEQPPPVGLAQPVEAADGGRAPRAVGAYSRARRRMDRLMGWQRQAGPSWRQPCCHKTVHTTERPVLLAACPNKAAGHGKGG